MNQKISIAILATILFCCNSLFPANTRWTWTGGSGTSSWTDKGNWTTTDNDSFIGSADTVLVVGNATVYPQLTADATVDTYIMSGGWMFTAGNTLFVNNNIYIYGGEFNAYLSGIVADNVYMTGGGLGVGSGLDISNDIVVDGGYFVTFTGGVVINHNFYFLSGLFDLNNYDLTINDDFIYECGDIINAGVITVDTLTVDFQGTDTLLNHINVLNSVHFIRGILKSSSGAMLIFDSEASYTGASDSSYVNGPVRRLIAASGNTAFEFPIGNDSVYAPLAISDFAQARSQDFFTAQYFMSYAPYNHASMDLTLNHVSSAEYWILDRGASAGTPTTDLKVTLFFNETTRSGQVDVASELRVVKWDGSTWKDLGRTSGTGNNTNGSLKSDSLVTSFSPFTIGSSTGGNPLPVSLLDFRAVAVDRQVKLSWSTTSEINNDFFTVEKSLDGKNWMAIGKLDAVGNSIHLRSYGFLDQSPVNGLQYYRLEQTDLDGKSTVSHIASVNFSSMLPETVAIFPNPVTDALNISIAEPVENASILVFNSIGAKVLELSGQSGTLFTVDMTGFEKGVYTIEFHVESGRNALKVIKN